MVHGASHALKKCRGMGTLLRTTCTVNHQDTVRRLTESRPRDSRMAQRVVPQSHRIPGRWSTFRAIGSGMASLLQLPATPTQAIWTATE